MGFVSGVLSDHINGATSATFVYATMSVLVYVSPCIFPVRWLNTHFDLGCPCYASICAWFHSALGHVSVYQRPVDA